MKLETERLIIRDMLQSDWEHVHSYSSLPEVAKYASWGPNTEEDTHQYIHHVLTQQQQSPRNAYELAVCIKDQDLMIGSVAIFIEKTNAELGYVLHPEHHGKGYATEAAMALLDYGFNTLGVHRVFATCRPANRASEQVMKRIGMQREGLLREHWHFKGAYHDSLLYSILASEYGRSPVE